ncbi:MAG: hypothetical protein A3G41_06620 [Elusimicrobia bacterium RIFCSPLOWO2_12_FULL_59_9]|nr:MAG: hypothetical protein A3G41_06620 [Elusimicrobia bacterium RIFCSPLOWO2_12_FULL_59_9]
MSFALACFEPAFCVNLPPVASGVEAKEIAWGDSAYYHSWLYLAENEPEIRKSWQLYNSEQQFQIVEAASEKGGKRWRQVDARRKKIAALCGEKGAKGGDGPVSGNSCDWKAYSRVTNEEIGEISMWIGRQEAEDIRFKRDRTLRLMLNLNSGKLDDTDLWWARSFLPPKDAGEIERFAAETKSAPAQSARLKEIQKQFLPEHFDPRKTSSQLAGASMDIGKANRLFDGALRPAAPPKSGVAASGNARRAAAKEPQGEKELRGNLMASIPSPERPPAGGENLKGAEDLLLTRPEEKEFSAKWNGALKERLNKNPRGKELVEYLGGDLPPVAISRDAKETAIATYSPGARYIELKASSLSEEISHFDPGAKISENPRQLNRYLLEHPEVRAKVLDSYEVTMVHELAHAAQDRGFKTSHSRDLPQHNLLEHEQQAKDYSLKYAVKKMERDPAFLRSPSPVMAGDRRDLEACLTDYDRCMADVGTRYKKEEAPPLKEALSRLPPPGEGGDKSRRAREHFQAQQKYYGEFFEDSRREWGKESPQGLLLLAERQEPREALKSLTIAHSRLPSADEETQRRYPGTADRTLKEYARQVRLRVETQNNPAESARMLREYEQTGRKLDRPVRDDLADLRRPAYTEAITWSKNIFINATALDSKYAIQTAENGVFYARTLGDTESEEFFRL